MALDRCVPLHPLHPRTCAPTLFHALAGLMLAVSATAAQAQMPRGDTSLGFEPFVPGSCRIYISLADGGDLERILLNSQAAHFLSLFTGGNIRQGGFEPGAIMTTFLGPGSRMTASELRGIPIAIAARSWSELADGVLFLRVENESALSRWFPDQRATRISRQAKLLRAEGTTISTRGGIMAASRAPGADSLMRETLRLMAGRATGSLDQVEEYKRLEAHLPAQPLVTFYATDAPAPRQAENTDRTDEPSSDVSTPGESGSKFPHVIAALYARDDRVEVAVRAKRSAPQARVLLGDATIKQFRQLPQTTVLAWAGSWDAFGFSDDGPEWQQRWLRFLRQLGGDAEAGEIDPTAFLGNHLIVVLDRDAQGSGATPQFALVAESAFPRELNNWFSRVIEAMLDRMYVIDPVDPEHAPAIELSTYLGIPLSTIDFAEYAQYSTFPGAKLLRRLQPSWAASGNWWHFALTRSHLQRMLEAQSGVTALLGDLPDMKGWGELASKPVSLAIGQIGTMTGIFERWVADAVRGEVSLLNPAAWSGSLFVDMMEPDRLGIIMQSDQNPGTVVVARVDETGASAGHLLPGDRILGIDGELLDLNSPNSDFRKRWSRMRSAAKRTLRIERDGSIMDVTLDCVPTDLHLPAIPRDASLAIANISRIGRNIPFASFTEIEAGPHHFAALISVKMARLDQESADAATGPAVP